MSYINIFVHAVWGTKDREPSLEASKRLVLFDHIKENAIAKRIQIDTLNGYVDHVHCVLRLESGQDIRTLMQLIKGESSYWANKHGLFGARFQWAEDYYAGSVSVSGLSKVRAYINSQEQHHSKVTFQEEYEALISDQGAIRG